MVAKPCLLVVDDEPDLVQSVQDLLRRDYRVLGATRARQGLELMQTERVDIVMSDQRMPEMSGVEMLCQIREAYPDAVRLLITGYADLTAVIDAINQGNVYRYISKPFNHEDLKATLRQAYEYHQLHEERRRLLQEVQAKNAQLETANVELRRANELKKAFIKVASHELRTPLTILLGLAEQTISLTEAQPELHLWTGKIHHSAPRLHDRIDQMVKQLLADRFDRPLQRQEIDAGPLIHAAVGEISQFVELRHLQLQLAIPDDLGKLNVEPDKIRDSLAQLLMNAIKFTPNGGTIRLEASRVNLLSPPGSLRVAVADTGIGIETDCLARIFEPFFTRFDVSRHSSGTFEYNKRGLGLGLSVAKAFVEMHGGHMTVESTLGKGTTFTMELPAS
jgi:signal transduction histidine kinase